MKIQAKLSRWIHQFGWRLATGLAILSAALIVAVLGLPDGKLHVAFLDVGQGDAILIRTPGGSHLLIDGGPSPTTLLDELGRRLPFWDRRLDLVVLTHPDGDHMNGLIEAIARYPVAQILQQPGIEAESEAQPWLEAVRRTNTPAMAAAKGTRIVVDGVILTVLAPGTESSLSENLDENNRSVVLRVQYGERAFLLTGDAEAIEENDMIRSGEPLDVDVLKVGHHGSANGTTDAFVTATSPAIAVIQVGDENRYGHPSPPVLDRLSEARVLRTDLDGTIEMTTDGAGLWVSTATERGKQMRMLMFMARQFWWKSYSKTLETAVEQQDENEVADAVVVFMHVEEQDAADRDAAFRKSLKNVKWLANKRELKRVVLHSFTHLGGTSATPDFAGVFIADLADRLVSNGYEVHITPFGYFNEWNLSVYGESLGKVWKEF